MGKYDPLCKHLEAAESVALEMTFAELERIVGPLPRSARTYREWWANEHGPGRHVQAHAWMGARRQVELVDLNRMVVRFSAPSTQANYRQIAASPERFEPHGVAFVPV